MELSKYIDEIAAAYNAAYKKLDAWRIERDNARIAFNEKADKLTREAVVEENNRMVEEFTKKSDAIKSELMAVVTRAEGAFKQELKAFYMVNGKAIDTDDKAALDSGIMTVNEVSEMVVKHSENPTMLRIIQKYVIGNKMNLETKIERALRLATSEGERELKALKRMTDLLNNAINIALSTEYSRELFLNTALKKDYYVQEAKIALLEAKLFIDEKTREVLEQYAAEQAEDGNKKYDPHNIDYNW